MRPDTEWRAKNRLRLSTPTLSDKAAVELGAVVDPKAAEDLFIAANTKQIKEERFQCLLPPNKVFKSADFVARYIQKKHADALRLAKEESAYVHAFARGRNTRLRDNSTS